MDIPQIDRSNYLKGLLITARKDKQLTETEKDILKNISAKLGFSTDFLNEITANLLVNKYITEDPIKFSSQNIAKSFIEDGLKLAYSDNNISGDEMKWLLSTASINGIEKEWIKKKLTEIKSSPKLASTMEFALFSLI